MTNPLTPEELAAIRERFEAWYCNRYKDRRDISKLRHRQGYWDNKIEFSWNAWQAALEAGAWRPMTEAPEIGRRIIALFDDYSGAQMFYVADTDRWFDQDGDEGGPRDDPFASWSYLPGDARLFCETHGGDEAFDFSPPKDTQ